MTTSGPKPRLRQYAPTLRDLAILLALHTARYLTTHQIQRLFWLESRGGAGGQQKACQRRMRILLAQQLVRRIEVPIRRGDPRPPFIYTLDKAGAQLLSREIGIDLAEIEWKPKAQEEHYPFLEHLLSTTDLHIALMQACQRRGVILEEWLDEKELKSAQMADQVTLIGPSGGEFKTAVVPDGYCKITRDGKSGIFFLEIDLRNVTIAPTIWERRGWLRKMRAYLAYFQSDAYRVRYGNRRARVLTITTGMARLEHLKKATESIFAELVKAGESSTDQNRFWFTTFDDALDPAKLLTASIWSVAGSEELRAIME
jgi:hypothetical protein